MKRIYISLLTVLLLCVCTVIPAHAASDVHPHEQAVVRLVNAERAQRGLSALSLNSTLCRYARIKSEDLRQNGYFSHTSPTYGTPFEMMRTFGISYQHAGENIAMGFDSPSSVFAAWMQSESHRTNILSPSYHSLGVGYVSAGGYWTQWFIG